jgi:putative ATPase
MNTPTLEQIPLADRMRPKKIEEIVGQDHLLGAGGFIANLIKQQRAVSILLWGPPGSGKTTLARIYAKALNANFVSFSAVFAGVGDLKKVVKDAKEVSFFNKRTVLFVDEIHRFNKAQQDGFLPYLEDGTIILIGATTENPSFALNDALLSRVQVLTLKALNVEALDEILKRYEKNHTALNLTEQARDYLLKMAQGDGRYLLNMVETLRGWSEDEFDIDTLQKILQKRSALFDKTGEGHHNLISALHKSIRGSDPEAALYWFARMLEGGEDPLYLARRMIRMATEDIGLADPTALTLATTAREAYHVLGSPEGDLVLAEAVVYLALAPKSNAIYTAFAKAKKLAASTGHLPPPKKILNAPTKLMAEEDYSKGYIYDHDTEYCFSGQNYFPDGIPRPNFYTPVERGYEREMKQRIQYFELLRKKLKNSV